MPRTAEAFDRAVMALYVHKPFYLSRAEPKLDEFFVLFLSSMIEMLPHGEA